MDNDPASDAASDAAASQVWLPPGPWASLLDFLDQRFPRVGREQWRQRLHDGKLSDDSGATPGVDAPYLAGRTLRYYREVPAEAEIPFEAQVLYRDAHLLVADKPHFLPTMPAGRYVQQCLLARLRRQTGLAGLTPLHRLDRETAGLVLFSVDTGTRAAYSALFATRRIAKTYEALAPMRPDLPFPLTRRSRIVSGTPFFRMQEVDGEPNAETRIELIEVRDGHGHYRLHPLSGKKHQLRLHMAALGLPIIGDRWYPQLQDEAPDDYAQPLKLLARRLAFDDPLSGERRVFESRLSLS